jgi:hypothetical protein
MPNLAQVEMKRITVYTESVIKGDKDDALIYPKYVN